MFWKIACNFIGSVLYISEKDELHLAFEILISIMCIFIGCLYLLVPTFWALFQRMVLTFLSFFLGNSFFLKNLSLFHLFRLFSTPLPFSSSLIFFVPMCTVCFLPNLTYQNTEWQLVVYASQRNKSGFTWAKEEPNFCFKLLSAEFRSKMGMQYCLAFPLVFSNSWFF